MCGSVFFISSKSKYHEKNEDTCFIGDNFIIVADGMGGECNGDIASKIAVETVSKILTERLSSNLNRGLIELMFSAINQADKNITKYIDEHPESDGMGTTLLIMIHQNETISIAWCGDSRCYVYNDGVLCSLTKDHSYVQELIDAKKISIEESFSHPDNNIITRFVGGGEARCVPEYLAYRIKDKEIIVLCSDGLSGYCKEDDIAKVINSNKNIQSLPEQLKKLAIQNGSDDDITIVTFSPGALQPRRKYSSLLEWFRRK